MRLGAAVFVEIAIDPVAERDDPEDLAGLGRFLRIERFDGAPKLGEVGADPGVLVDRLDRPVEEAVRRAGGFGDFLAAHRGQLVDLLAEFRAVGIERGQLIDELADALVELARFLGLERDQPRGLGGRDRLKRLGRVELELGLGFGRRFGGHGSRPFAANGGAVARLVNGRQRRARAFGCIIGAKIQRLGARAEGVNAD